MPIILELNDEELSYLNAFMAETLKSSNGLSAVAAVYLFQQKILCALQKNKADVLSTCYMTGGESSVIL